MENKRLTITVLTDKTSWMNRFDQDLAGWLRAEGHDVMCVSSREDLRCGDIAFFLSCFEIVRAEYLARNRHNIVVHASALPSGKGWSPTTWQILEGKNEIPLSLFEATESVDEGAVYARDVLCLDGSELVGEWQAKLGVKIVEMCLAFVKSVVDGSASGQKQSGAESFYRRRRPEDSRLDVDRSLREQFNLLRVVDNQRYPAFFDLNGRRYRIEIYGESNG